MVEVFTGVKKEATEMERNIAVLVTGFYKTANFYRAIIKPKISERLHIHMLSTTLKLDAIDFAENIAKALAIEYVGEFEYEERTGKVILKEKVKVKN